MKLTDFGISRLAPGGRVDQIAAGTPSAVSPEQYLGESVDSRSDLFSLGCLLYRLITGERPFYRGGRLAPEFLLAEDPVPPTEFIADGIEVPAALTGIVMRLLQKKPENRPPNTHELRSILRSVSRDLPLSASGQLLAQSRVYFRPESADDIPVHIPADLGREGRSHLPVPWLRFGWYAGSRLRWFTKTGLLLCAAALIVTGLIKTMPAGESAVLIELRRLEVAGDASPPRELSPLWLVEQVSQVAEEKLGKIRVLGAIGATPDATVYAGEQSAHLPADPQESFEISLHCVHELCIVDLQRVWKQGRSIATEQLLLFPDAPIKQWRETLRAGVRELYP